MVSVAYSWHTRRGKLGWLLSKTSVQGADEIIRSCDYPVLDHAEFWEERAGLGRRRLVSHPYYFDEKMRAALEAMHARFGLLWSATPPGKSWYDPLAWVIEIRPEEKR